MTERHRFILTKLSQRPYKFKEFDLKLIKDIEELMLQGLVEFQRSLILTNEGREVVEHDDFIPLHTQKLEKKVIPKRIRIVEPKEDEVFSFSEKENKFLGTKIYKKNYIINELGLNSVSGHSKMLGRTKFNKTDYNKFQELKKSIVAELKTTNIIMLNHINKSNLSKLLGKNQDYIGNRKANNKINANDFELIDIAKKKLIRLLVD